MSSSSTLSDPMREKLFAAHDHYRQQALRLLQELSGYSDEALHKKPAADSWSAMQTAWHLVRVEETSLQYLRKKLSFGGAFQRPGMSASWRSLLLTAALYVPLRFKAPAGSSGEHLPEKSSMAELQEKWAAVEGEWRVFLEELPAELLDKAVFKHPRAGRLSWGQTFGFMRRHLHRHTGQIRRALRKQG